MCLGVMFHETIHGFEILKVMLSRVGGPCLYILSYQ